jgi:hypothetical protein
MGIPEIKKAKNHVHEHPQAHDARYDDDDDLEPHVIDLIRLVTLPSTIVSIATSIAERFLKNVGIRNARTDITNSIASISFCLIKQMAEDEMRDDENKHEMSTCSIILRHHSPISVLVYICQSGQPIGPMVMWSPNERPWMLMYLIAGYYRIPRAVHELHHMTSDFCQFDDGVDICKICKLARGRAIPPRQKKVKYKLVPQYESDDSS